MATVKNGDKVKVEYTGKLEDGTIFDSSEKQGEPLEFTVGQGQLIKGFEQAVVGMQIGEEKQITLAPEEAYGQYNPELVREMPKENFPTEEEIQPGMMFLMNLPDGRQIPVRITAVTEETITLDLNSPLAGKTLIFIIKVLEVAS